MSALLRTCLFLAALAWPACPVGAEGFPPGGSFPLHVELERVFGLVDRAPFVDLVERTGERAAEATGRDPRRFRFSLLDSHAVDAFALPGGFVYLTRGRLAAVSSRRELQALLADLIARAEAVDLRRDQREAEPWGRFRGIGWPAENGPAVLLRDRVESAVAHALRPPTQTTAPAGAAAELRELLRALPRGPNPDHGVREPDGRFIHRALGFAWRGPPGWQVRGGARVADARAPDGSAALEVVAFPSALGLDALVERSLREVERERRIEIEDAERSSGSHYGLEYLALDYRLVRGRNEVPARCVWIRSGRRVHRLLAVSTLEAHWRQPDRLGSLWQGFRPLVPEGDAEEDANAPN